MRQPLGPIRLETANPCQIRERCPLFNSRLSARVQTPFASLVSARLFLPCSKGKGGAVFPPKRCQAGGGGKSGSGVRVEKRRRFPTHSESHPANPMVTRKAPAFAGALGELWDGNDMIPHFFRPYPLNHPFRLNRSPLNFYIISAYVHTGL